MARQRTAEGRMPDHGEAGTPGVDEAPVDPGVDQPTDGENRGELVGDGGEEGRKRAPAPTYGVEPADEIPESVSFRKGNPGGRGRASQWPGLLNQANETRQETGKRVFKLADYNTKTGAQTAAKDLNKIVEGKVEGKSLPTFDGVTLRFKGVRTGESTTALYVEFVDA